MAVPSSSKDTAKLDFVRLTAAESRSASSGQDVMLVTLRSPPGLPPLYRAKIDKQSRQKKSEVPALRISRARNDKDVPFAMVILNDNNPLKASIELGHGQKTEEVRLDLTSVTPASTATTSAGGGRRSSHLVRTDSSSSSSRAIKLQGLKLPGNSYLAFSWHLSSNVLSPTTSATAYVPSETAPEISPAGDSKPKSPSSSKPARPKDVRAIADHLHLVDQHGERYATYYNTYARSSTTPHIQGNDSQKATNSQGQETHGYLEILPHLIDHEFTDKVVASLIAVLECHLRAVEERKHGKGKAGLGFISSGCVVC